MDILIIVIQLLTLFATIALLGFIIGRFLFTTDKRAEEAHKEILPK